MFVTLTPGGGGYPSLWCRRACFICLVLTLTSSSWLVAQTRSGGRDPKDAGNDPEERPFNDRLKVVHSHGLEQYDLVKAEELAPRLAPYAFGGLSLNGTGYLPLSGTVGGGVAFETKRALGAADVEVNNARKRDSGTGHGVGASVRVFYPIGTWHFGAGAQWSKLFTRDYSKQAWRPVLGGGKDIFRGGESARIDVVYVLPGTDRLNALQGPQIGAWYPSPAVRGHFFFHMALGLYEFHQTAVPGNPGTQNRYSSVNVHYSLAYRF